MRSQSSVTNHICSLFLLSKRQSKEVYFMYQSNPELTKLQQEQATVEQQLKQLQHMFMHRTSPADTGYRMWRSAITTSAYFPPHYSMTCKTEKRHDRNHAVSRKQYTVLLGRPSRGAFFACRPDSNPFPAGNNRFSRFNKNNSPHLCIITELSTKISECYIMCPL